MQYVFNERLLLRCGINKKIDVFRQPIRMLAKSSLCADIVFDIFVFSGIIIL